MFISPQNKIIKFFVIATAFLAILFMFSLASLFYKTTINIVSKQKDVDANLTTTLNTTIEINTVSAKNTFTPTALVSMEDFATGEAVITNRSKQNQVLVANTRLLSSSELLFRLTNKVTIPSGETKRVTIRADKTGQDYEIGPTKFTIPGLSSILQTQVFAESDKSTTGGLKKAGIVTQKDIDNAVESLKNELIQNSIKELEKKYADQDNFKIAIKPEVIKENISAKPNEEKTQFTAEVILKIIAALVNEEKLLKSAQEKLGSNVPAGYQLYNVNKSSLAYRFKDYDPKNQTATFEIYLNGRYVISEKNDRLSKSNFLNLSRTQIKDRLQKIEDIDSFKVSMFPPLFANSPKNENCINIKIK